MDGCRHAVEIEIIGAALPDLEIGTPAEIEMETQKPDGDLPPGYDGPTEVTPSGETQVLYTSNRIVREDIVVRPIPSNWGRISYNGVALTVE